jgi:N-acetylmuramoyl-L-alanine amidase
MPSQPTYAQRPSPNHGPRAAGKPIDILLLHYTGMKSEEGALAWLASPQSNVSAHYFVGEDGAIVQMVDEAERAWHAGASFWAGERDINTRSIGIEIANPGHEFGYRSFPLAEVAAVVALCRDILARHPIPPQRVLAHSDVAPLRKEDPGELFPWGELNADGVGHWVMPEAVVAGPELKLGDSGEAVANLKQRFRSYGYGLGAESDFDEEMAAVVRAFQRHFRPALVDGIADVSTIATLDRLIATLPAAT